MSIHFNGSGNYALRATGTTLSDWPISMACWFNVEDITSLHMLMGCGNDNGGTQPRCELMADGNRAGDPVQFGCKGNTTYRSARSSAYSANTWHHAAGVCTSAALGSVFLDGTGKVTAGNASEAFVETIDDYAIGSQINVTQAMIGKVAECAIWDVELTDAEVALLALGLSPLFIRPDSIVFYVPGIAGNAEVDRFGAPLTVTGTATPDTHPRIIQPFAQVLPFPTKGKIWINDAPSWDSGAVRQIHPGPNWTDATIDLQQAPDTTGLDLDAQLYLGIETLDGKFSWRAISIEPKITSVSDDDDVLDTEDPWVILGTGFGAR